MIIPTSSISGPEKGMLTTALIAWPTPVRSSFREYGRVATSKVCLRLLVKIPRMIFFKSYVVTPRGWIDHPRHGRVGRTDCDTDKFSITFYTPLQPADTRNRISRRKDDVPNCSIITDQGRVEYKAGHPLYLLSAASSSQSLLHSES